jgi:hypothetical protein
LLTPRAAIVDAYPVRMHQSCSIREFNHALDKYGELMTTKRKFKTIDANEAVAYVAYRVNEVIAIYPITPSSAMGEWAHVWASQVVQDLGGQAHHLAELCRGLGHHDLQGGEHQSLEEVASAGRPV